VDRAVAFLRRCVKDEKPFLAVVWLHAPHYPVVAGDPYRSVYSPAPDSGASRRGRNAGIPDYRGCLTAMDEQIGRLREELRALGIAGNTALFFASDNGPVTDDMGRGPTIGSAGPFRGGKAQLLEGGIRVPALLEWPDRTGPRVVTGAWSVLDYLPTLAAAAGAPLPDAPLDGESLLPLLAGETERRERPIAFRHFLQIAWMDGPYKLLTRNRGNWWTLYDLDADPGEERDAGRDEPEVLLRMRARLDEERATWPEIPVPRRDESAGDSAGG
jgi:arylsulfatase A-like enzyme